MQQLVDLMRRARAASPGEVLWEAPGSMSLDRVRDAWERTGSPSGLTRLSGPWAVAVMDRSGDLLVINDPLGLMPVYWATDSSGAVLVASSLAAMNARLRPDPNLRGLLISEYSQCRSELALGITTLTGVRRLSGGVMLRVGSRPRHQRFWRPEDLPAPDTDMSRSQAVDLLRSALDGAIRRHVSVSEPIGAHLSGGLDSTTVACRAQAILAESGRSLVAGYSWSPAPDGGDPEDERRLVQQAADGAGIRVRWAAFDASGDWFFERDPAVHPQVSQLGEIWQLPLAADDGVTLMLSGWGGDEFASYRGRRVVDGLLRAGRVGQAWRAARSLSITDRAAARRMIAALARRRTRPGKDAIDALLRANDPFAADSRLEQHRAYRAVRDPRHQMLLSLRDGHLSHRAAAWHESGGLFGISYRYPLLDLEVIEAAMRIPWHLWLDQGQSRAVFREAVAGWVPGAVSTQGRKDEPAFAKALARGFTSTARPDIDPEVRAVLRLADHCYRLSAPQPPT